MDFSKAFDKVAHNRLLYKLERYGVSKQVRNWIYGFLSERTQPVVVEGECSELKTSHIRSTTGVRHRAGTLLGIHK